MCQASTAEALAHRRRRNAWRRCPRPARQSRSGCSRRADRRENLETFPDRSAQPLRRWPQDQASCGRRSSAPPAAPLPTRAQSGYVPAGTIGEPAGGWHFRLWAAPAGSRQRLERPWRACRSRHCKSMENGMAFKSSAYAAAAAVALFGATAILDATPASARCRGSIVRGEMATAPCRRSPRSRLDRSGARPCGRATAAAFTRWGVATDKNVDCKKGEPGRRWHCRALARPCDGRG